MGNRRSFCHNFNKYNYCMIVLLLIAITFKTVQTQVFLEKDQSINSKGFPYSNGLIQNNLTNHNLSNQDEITGQSLITNNQLKRLKRESAEPAYCGHLKLFGQKASIPIREGEKIPDLEFEAIFDKFTFGSVIVTNSQCKIEICGAVPYVNLGTCNDFWKSEAPILNPYFHSLAYILSSVSCGCQKNRSNCGSEKCREKSMDQLAQSNPKICGVLFQEEDCLDCLHDGILLEENKKFETGHGLAVKSFLVRPGCKMERTTFTSTFSSVPFRKVYFESESSLTVSYTRKGEYYICNC